MPYERSYHLNAALRQLCVIGLLSAALDASGCGPTTTAGGGGDIGTGPGCDGFNCNPNGCNATSDCAKGLKCDPKSHTCVACASDTDCPNGQVCGPNHMCAAGCASGHSCASDGGVCEADAGVCVQCLADGDCTDTNNPRCDPSSHTCFPCYTQNDNCGHATYCASSMNAYACAAGCKNDTDCPLGMGGADDGGGPGDGGAGGMSHCEKGSHACVECLVSEDCAAGKICSNAHACVDGCTNAHPCAGGKTCCTGACADVTSDTANCGGCGNACKAGLNCCASNCSDPAGDVSNCNGCGLVCKVPNATPACTMKMCAVGVCNAGFGDCDGAAANGCEVNLSTDVTHCGTCMTACKLANATPKCAGGVCQISVCAAGYADCNNKSADGCEINVLGSDLANCGMCGSACAVDNGSPQCAMGVCKVGTCNMGFGDCDGMAKNGCEVDLTSAVSNCGACGTACNLANATPQCISSHCAVASCNMGYADCNKVAADGCEVSIQTDTANCGACGNICSTNHGSASCAAGVCKISCAAGFADCNQNAADGCEVNVNIDAGNCGSCAMACSGANMSASSCSGGACTGTCIAGFGDCNGNLRVDGCETNLNSNVGSCGGCAMACSGANMSANTCSGGACTGTCANGFGDCDNNLRLNGCEINLNASLANCGGCGLSCPGTNMTQSACSGGACTGTCAAGFGDCDNNLRNGCETNTNVSVANCGGCGKACNGTNGTPSCANGGCSIVCSAGFGNCDNNVANGCEANLKIDAKNCNACGVVCGGSCVNGVCGQALAGQFNVSQGAAWGTNPITYTCQEACALLFGGLAAQYSCSTVGGVINHLAFTSIWGVAGCATVAETFKKGNTYNCGAANCSQSAYVNDNCLSNNTNFCWK